MRTIGPYEVVRELGRGGMGVVYEVRHPEIPRPLALKLILGHADDQALLRFAREAQVMARIRHPGVVTVHQLARVPEGPILVTDLVQGRSLTQVIQEALPRTIDPRRAATLVRALADALEACHAQGVLHRDLKPDNVIVRDDDAPVVLDFGIARDESAERLTQTGQLMGTPAYMSPEQAEGGSPTRLGPPTDVYGLGAILFALLAGRPPFEGGTSAMAIVKQVLTEEPRWPSQDRADVPWKLEAICRMAMAREPLSRYRTAAALRAELDAFLGGQHVAATERFRAPATPGLRRALVVGGLVALVAVAAGTALALALGPGAGPTGTSAAPVTTRVKPVGPRGVPAPVAVKPWSERVDEAAGQPFPQTLATLRQSALRLAADATKSDALPVYARFIDDTHVVTCGRNAAGPCVVRFWDLVAPASPTHEVTAGRDPYTNVAVQGPGRVLLAGQRGGVVAVDAAQGVATAWGERRLTDQFSTSVVALGDDEALVGRFTVVPTTVAGYQPTDCEVIRFGPARAPESIVRMSFPAMDLDVRGDLLAVVTARWSKGPDDPGEGELVVTRLGGGAPLLEAPLRTNGRRVELSRDGSRVAVGLGGGFMDVYELSSGKCQTLQSDAVNSTARLAGFSENSAHNALLNGLAFSLDGQRLWSACGQSDLLEPWDGEVRSWLLGAKGWSCVPPLTHPSGGTYEDRERKKERGLLLASVLSLELSPDGRVLLAGTSAGEALLLAVPREAR